MDVPNNFTVPNPPELTLARQRLIDKLQSSLQRKLTLIVAPPGYGKTTLIAQFVRALSLPVIWHSVEERERDLPNLLEHSQFAISAVFPDSTQEGLNKAPGTGDSAANITKILATSPVGETIYVMDDVHHLVGAPVSESWLRTFVREIPATCHLILVGRAIPHLPLAEMVSHRDVVAIGQEELRFTFQEISELAEKAIVNLSPSEIQTTLARLNGWPAGTILALQPLPGEIETLIFKGKTGPEALFDSLAEAMLNTQPPALRDFLLASSTISRMTPAICETVLRLSNSHKYLAEALSRNLFISQVSGGMEYHPLFRDFLQRQLESQKPDLFVQLHVSAANWFAENTRLEDAFEHYVAARLWDNAVEIAERAAQTYMSQGKTETVLTWNQKLKHLTATAPRVHYTAAMIYMNRYQYAQAHAELADAELGFSAANDDKGLFQVRMLAANIHYQQGEYRQAIDEAQRILNHPATPENIRAYAIYVIGTSSLQLGDAAKALEYLESTLPTWRAIGDKYSLSQLLLSLELVYTRLGRFSNAAACLEEVVAIQRALESASGLGMALNHLGYHYHLLGEYRHAEELFEEGLQVIDDIPETRVESYLLWSMGDLQRDRGAYREAQELYRKVLHLADTNEPSLRASVLLSLATLKRWEGNSEDALSLAHEIILLAEKHNLVIERLRAEACMWAVYAQQQKMDAVISALATIVDELINRQAQTRLVQVLGMLAHTALLFSDTTSANKWLRAAVEGVNHPANLQPLVAEIVHTPLLYQHVTRHAQKYPDLLKAVRDLEQAKTKTSVPETPEAAKSVPPTYSLRVWTLGQEYIERDGTPVPLSAWRAAAAREVFFYLLFQGRATRDQIGLALWPDSSPLQVRQTFHTTLYRIRKALGSNVILFEDNFYYINPDLDLWCDAFEFETMVQQGRLSSLLTAHTESLWRRAVELYENPFLMSRDSEWITAYREELHQTYLEALLALGNSLQLRGNTQGAIAIFRQALGVDPYREDTYRFLITCYATLGERSLIHRLLAELTQLLQTELGTSPSIETIALAQSFLN